MPELKEQNVYFLFWSTPALQRYEHTSELLWLLKQQSCCGRRTLSVCKVIWSYFLPQLTCC